jgi:hypothetical protein
MLLLDGESFLCPSSQLLWWDHYPDQSIHRHLEGQQNRHSNN